MISMFFCSDEFGEVNIKDIPISAPPRELEEFFEVMKRSMGLPLLKMRYISIETAKEYVRGLSYIGLIGCGFADEQIICVVETEYDDKIVAMMSLMIHEAVHTLGFYHGSWAEVVKTDDVVSVQQSDMGQMFVENNEYYHELLNCKLVSI